MPFTPEELSRIYDDYHAGQSASIPSSPKFTVDQLSQIYDQYQAENAKPVRGTAGEVAAGGALNLLNYPMMGFGDEVVAGGSALIDALQGNDFGSAYDQRLGTARDLRSKYRNEVQDMAPWLNTAQDVAGAFVNPGNALFGLTKAPTAIGRIAKNAAVSAGLSGATAFGESEGGAEDRLVEALRSGATGGVFGGAISGAGEGLSKVAKSIATRFPGWAETEYFTAMGAGKGDLTKSARQDGFTKGPNGELETQLRSALRAVREDGLLDDSWSPATVLGKAGDRSLALAKEVQGLVQKADESRGNIKVYPKFTNAEHYIENKAVATDRPALRKELDRWRDAIRKEGDGSIKFLQGQKVELGNRTYAGGQETAEAFEKALTADLRKAIEDTSEAALGKTGRTVAQVNKEHSNYKKIEEVLRNQAARNENRSIGDIASTLYKTTGGVMGGLIGGSLMGIGGGPGAALSGLALYSRTPNGRFMVAKALDKIAALGSKAIQPKLFNKLTPIERAVATLLPAQRALLIQEMNDANGSQSSSRTDQGRPIENIQQKKLGADSKRGNLGIDPPGRTLLPTQKRRLDTSRSSVGLGELSPSSLASSPEDSQLPLNSTPLPTPKITRENKELFQRVASEAIGKLPPLVQAMVSVESNGKIDAVSKKGAKGLLQLMPENVKRFKVADPFNPLENIRGGMALMREELDRFGDVKLALAAYNAGSPRVQAAIKAAKSEKFVDVYRYLPAETQTYVARVLSKLNELEA